MTFFITYTYRTKKIDLVPVKTEDKPQFFALLDEEKILVLGELGPYQSNKTLVNIGSRLNKWR